MAIVCEWHVTPIVFYCRETLPLDPEAIAQQILDLAKWSDFQGCWPIPGIRAAQFEVRTPEVIGTRIRVTNRDGSAHVEEVREWEPGHRLRLRMYDFSPPLSRLATAFDETWEFAPVVEGTTVTRSFQLHPKSALTRLPLRLIAMFLKRAIARHLREMKAATATEAESAT